MLEFVWRQNQLFALLCTAPQPGGAGHRGTGQPGWNWHSGKNMKLGALRPVLQGHIPHTEHELCSLGHATHSNAGATWKEEQNCGWSTGSISKMNKMLGSLLRKPFPAGPLCKWRVVLFWPIPPLLTMTQMPLCRGNDKKLQNVRLTRVEILVKASRMGSGVPEY